MNEQLQTVNHGIGFHSDEAFTALQRIAKVFSMSELVPDTFKGDKGFANCVIALEMAGRMKASPLAVMQNIYIVHGKPAWSSQFVIACLNSCGRYSPLRFEVSGEGQNKSVTAWAVEEATGQRLSGPPVTMTMANGEGWVNRTGSKWKTMPDLMMRYRAATFFGRLYAPEMLMGMRTVEEVIEIEATAEPMQRESVPTFTAPKPTPQQDAQHGPPAVVTPTEPEKRRGRPPGAKNKPVEDKPLSGEARLGGVVHYPEDDEPEAAKPAASEGPFLAEPAVPDDDAPPLTPHQRAAKWLDMSAIDVQDFLGWLASTGETEVKFSTLGDVDEEVLSAVLSKTEKLAKCVRLYGKEAK